MTKSEKWAEWAGWVLLAIGGVARVAGAWGARVVRDMDSSVVALMARHIANGTDWPVFFYGQSYMGSLEPTASALLMKAFGDNGFMLALGTVAFAMLALWALWRWARAASGAWGGVAALALGAVGPMVYFSFQFVARGGYMAAVAICVLVLWGAAGLAADWWNGRGGGAARAGMLGLLAGLGLWTDPIVAPALGAAVLVLLLGMRGRFWKHWGAVGAGVAGTVAGSAPCWLWWLGHESAGLLPASGGGRSLRAAAELTWHRYLMFQGAGLSRELVTVLALAGIGLAAAGGTAWLLSAKKRDARSNFATLGAALFVALFAAAFVFSGFYQAQTGRYWVPTWPAMALLASWACTGWGRGKGAGTRRQAGGRAVAWMVLVALAATQAVLAVQDLAAAEKGARDTLGRFAELRRAVAETGADAVIAPRSWYPLNFAWEEEVPVSDGLVAFHEPIRRAAELAEHPAYFGDWAGVRECFRRMGLASQRAAGGFVFHHVEVPPMREIVGWRLSAPVEHCAVLELGEPRPVERVAFFIHRIDRLRGVPLRVDVDVRESGVWRTVHENAALSCVSWSGTRAYPNSSAYQEFTVDAPAAEAVRVMARGPLKARLKSIDLVAGGPGILAPDVVGDAENAVREILALAGDDAVVFAPRWLANRLHRSGRLPDDRNHGLSDFVFDAVPSGPRAVVPAGVPFVAAVERCHAPMVREAFALTGVAAAESAAPDGVWSFFRADALPAEVSLFWNGRWFGLED